MSWCVLVEHVKENYYARFHDPSYHRNRERYISILLNYYARFHDPSYHRYRDINYLQKVDRRTN